MSPTFASLGVPSDLCRRLDDLGISEPFPVQAATLPDALSGRDVCGKAPTGSGKTIAFALPLLARIERAEPRKPTALILVPTRELASQVCDQFQALTHGTKTRILAVYGGAGMGPQIKAINRGVEVVVATPGRLKDLIERRALRLDHVSIAVIDEADRMADMGFLPEVRRLLDMTNKQRQTMLFSATLDGDVDVLVRNYQRNPAHHEAISLEEQGEVTHEFWSVAHAQRVAIATAVVERSWPAIVFSRTKHGADRLSKQLRKNGIRSEAIHGNRSQSQRERALGAFGRGDVQVLVATDVAARGIHVDGVACVLQFDAPATDKDYVHRAGRTGRAGEPGTVITLVLPEKVNDVRKMQRDLDRPEQIEPSPLAEARSQSRADRSERRSASNGKPRSTSRPDDGSRSERDSGRPRSKPATKPGSSPHANQRPDHKPTSKRGDPGPKNGRGGRSGGNGKGGQRSNQSSHQRRSRPAAKNR